MENSWNVQTLFRESYISVSVPIEGKAGTWLKQWLDAQVTCVVLGIWLVFIGVNNAPRDKKPNIQGVLKIYDNCHLTTSFGLSDYVCIFFPEASRVALRLDG